MSVLLGVCSPPNLVELGYFTLPTPQKNRYNIDKILKMMGFCSCISSQKYAVTLGIKVPPLVASTHPGTTCHLLPATTSTDS